MNDNDNRRLVCAKDLPVEFPTEEQLQMTGKRHAAIRRIIIQAREQYPTAHADKILRIVAGAVFDVLSDQIDELNARLAAVEARPEIRDCGVWRQGAYKHGAAVSHDGSLWIAQRDTTARPGGSDSWRLAVKRGRDGKDARR